MKSALFLIGRCFVLSLQLLDVPYEFLQVRRAREALFERRPVSGNSTFDVTEDAWVCYVAIEVAGKAGRAVAVEILDAYAFDDCGGILDVNVLRVMPPLPDGGVRHWVLDLEDVGGISPGEESPHGQDSGDGE